ncbi:MAG: hypothetical protein ACYC1U_09280 [Candidatus Aquicultorales bacterium]
MTKEYDAVVDLNAEGLQQALGLLCSQVRWDLIKFFKANPFSIHTSQGLASIIGRQQTKVEDETQALVEEKLLKRISQEDGFPPIYAYDPDPELAAIVDLLETACTACGDHVDKVKSDVEETLRSRGQLPQTAK